MTPQPTLDTIVFDIGDVLVAWDPSHVLRPAFETEGELLRFIDEVFLPWNELTNEGLAPDEAYDQLEHADPAHRRWIHEYGARFPETLTPIAESLALLDAVRDEGHRLLALTNWSRELFPTARTFDWLAHFEGVVVSGHEGTRKPRPEIYRVLLERYDVDPARAAYIDDRADNVETAAQLGLTALQFTGPDAFRRDLVRLGLLPG